MKYNIYVEDVSVQAVFDKLRGVGGAKRFLRDELVLVEQDPKSAVPEPLDFTVRLDRFVVLPSWADPNWLTQEFMNLQTTGLAEYNLQSGVEQLLHDDQKTGVVSGNIIYRCLKNDDALANQLGLADLLAIQKMGVGVFRALFKSKAVFGWKSVVRKCGSHKLYVPYLYEHGDIVVLCWCWLDNDWNSYHPALRFRK